MSQDYYLLRSDDYESIMPFVVDALSRSEVGPFSDETTLGDCATAYAKAYGTTFATLGILKNRLDFAQPFDPSAESTPF